MKHALRLSIIALLPCACDASKTAGIPGGESRMRDHFESAKTPVEELEASEALHRRFTGYAVQAFNQAGDEIFPHRTGDYNAIDRVKITFRDSDVVASRKILNRDSLTLIYGE